MKRTAAHLQRFLRHLPQLHVTLGSDKSKQAQSLAFSNSAVLGFETTERLQRFCETKLCASDCVLRAEFRRTRNSALSAKV